MNILITGHKGFIGSHLCKALSNHKLIKIDKPTNLLNCNLNYKVDLVIHLAAIPGVRYSLKHPIKTIFNNVVSSYRIFKNFKCRILYASSSTVYEPYRNPYAFSKWIIEKIAPTNALGLRFHTVYNKKERPEMFCSKLFLNKITYIVKDTKRDFVHISDVIQCIKLLIKHNINKKTVDVGTGKTILLEKLVKNVKLIKRKFYDRKQNKADIRFLKKIGYKPKINFINYFNKVTSSKK